MLLHRSFSSLSAAKVVKSAEEAVANIQSGTRVFVHTAAAAPQKLIVALTARHKELRDVELTHLHTEGVAPYVAPGMEKSFRCNALFVGSNVRAAVRSGQADFTPVFLSEIPRLFRDRILPLDYALVTVSPPDRHGYCSLGTSVDVSLAAVESAKVVIAQVNRHLPRTHGQGMIHASRLHVMVECDEPIPEAAASTNASPAQQGVARNVAALIEDGACLQMGIGVIPDLVLSQLKGHKRLGVHTEMFSEGVIDLVNCGAITGENKVIYPRKLVSSFAVGSRRLYDFLDDNPLCAFLDVAFVNSPAVIRQNPRVHAINSCIEIDLTGQVCSDSVGSLIHSGVGGQMDFMRGAALSEGGKPILAFTSLTPKGASRITPFLKTGAGVVTTRSHVRWVVTEYGAANLYGMSLRRRHRALIDLAHPSVRPALEKSVEEHYWNSGQKE